MSFEDYELHEILTLIHNSEDEEFAECIRLDTHFILESCDYFINEFTPEELRVIDSWRVQNVIIKLQELRLQ